MYEPEKEREFNALPLPHRARHVTIRDAKELLGNLPQLAAYKQHEQYPAQEVIEAMPVAQVAPEAIVQDQLQNADNVVILDEYRERNVSAAQQAVEAAHNRMAA